MRVFSAWSLYVHDCRIMPWSYTLSLPKFPKLQSHCYRLIAICRHSLLFGCSGEVSSPLFANVVLLWEHLMAILCVLSHLQSSDCCSSWNGRKGHLEVVVLKCTVARLLNKRNPRSACSSLSVCTECRKASVYHRNCPPSTCHKAWWCFRKAI